MRSSVLLKYLLIMLPMSAHLIHFKTPNKYEAKPHFVVHESGDCLTKLLFSTMDIKLKGNNNYLLSKHI